MNILQKTQRTALSLSLLLSWGIVWLHAQQAGLIREVLSGGAGMPSASAHYYLFDVIGQPSPAGPSASQHFYLQAGFLFVPSTQMTASAILALPSGASGVSGSIVQIPISVTTDSLVRSARFVIQYNSAVLTFQNAVLGRDLSPTDFSIQFDSSPGFGPSAPGCDRNVLVQISSTTSSFTGNGREVVVLEFLVGGTPGETSPLIFDRSPQHTYLLTPSGRGLYSASLNFQDGSVTVSSGFSVSGWVKYYTENRPVPGVHITLEYVFGGGLDTVTNAKGQYHFASLSPGDIRLWAQKNDDVQGITGADALLILKHLAYLSGLTPGQKFAADVTQDRSVTGADALAVLRYLAFFRTNIGATGTWVFQPDSIQASLSGDLVDQNFTAYLLGDVTGDWHTATLNRMVSPPNAGQALEKSGQNPVVLAIRTPRLSSKTTVIVPVSIDQLDVPVHTIIFTVEYDSSQLRFKSANRTSLTRKFLYAVNGQEKGRIHVAMAAAEALQRPGDVLELIFELRNAASLSEGSQIQFTRAFVNDRAVSDLVNDRVYLESVDAILPDRFELKQNYPNPFNPATTIRYTLPEGQDEYPVDMLIYNLAGQIIRRLEHARKPPGYYTVTWDGRDEKGNRAAPGIYFCRIRAGKYRASMKMILLK